MKVCIVNFSNRSNGNCKSIAALLKSLYLKDNVKVFNYSSMAIEACGKCNYECLKAKTICPYNDKIKSIYTNISNSDLCYYILPNYCDYPCSNFFVFNERGCGFFNKSKEKLNKYLNVKKKFIVISNSNTSNFENILKYHINDNKLDILFLSTKKFGITSINDNLLINNHATKLIQDFAFDNYFSEESAMGIVLYQNRILATKEDVYGNIAFSLPKGHIENNETNMETAIQEVEEETGFKVDKKDFIKELEGYEVKFINHHYQLIKKKITPILFKVDKISELTIKEKRVQEVDFYNIYEFFKNCSYNNLKDILLDILKDLELERV